MARVRCITMQKDEGLLLDAWLRYYGYLFGFENIEVLDNGSRDRLTTGILEQFEAAGVVVHWCCSPPTACPARAARSTPRWTR